MRPLKKVETKRLFEEAQQHYPNRVQLAFLLQSLEDPLDVGSMFRVADSCGAAELIFTGTTLTPPNNDIERTGRGHERRIAWRRIPRLEDALAALKCEGYHLVALETAKDAKCYLEYEFPDKVCLVLGNESKGVYPATLTQCDGAVYIPMYGKGPSMNVHVAGALVAYRAVLGKQ